MDTYEGKRWTFLLVFKAFLGGFVFKSKEEIFLIVILRYVCCGVRIFCFQKNEFGIMVYVFVVFLNSAVLKSFPSVYLCLAARLSGLPVVALETCLEE